MTAAAEGLRVDKWLWFARLAKTRGLAQRWIAAGEVSLNGAGLTRPSAAVRPGDLVGLPWGRARRQVRVMELAARRGNATAARALYTEEPVPHCTEGTIPPLSEGCFEAIGCARQSAMIDHIVSLLFGAERAAVAAVDDVHVATAALLVEAAQVDGTFGEDERTRILALLGERFGFAPGAASVLLDRAVRLQEDSSQIFPLTRTLVEGFSPTQRIEIIEMLWEVVYADGRLHDYEANLVRRVAGLLYVPDRDSGAARRRALNRLGLPDSL